MIKMSQFWQLLLQKIAMPLVFGSGYNNKWNLLGLFTKFNIRFSYLLSTNSTNDAVLGVVLCEPAYSISNTSLIYTSTTIFKTSFSAIILYHSHTIDCLSCGSIDCRTHISKYAISSYRMC